MIVKPARSLLGAAAALLVAGCTAGGEEPESARPALTGPYADAPPYLAPAGVQVEIEPLLTVGQRIPESHGAEGGYRVVGIPDGMGVFEEGGRVHLLSTHELRKGMGGPAGPVPSGSRICEFVFERTGEGDDRSLRAVSGACAMESIHAGDPPVPVEPGTRPIARLCSATLVDERHGFDRRIFFSGEEAHGEDTFDGRGGQLFALAGGEIYAIQRAGRFSWENGVPVPNRGERTAIFGLEDGPGSGDGLHSQLYLYVGAKRRAAEGFLARNGLDDGRLHVLVAEGHAGERDFHSRDETIRVRWVEVDWRLDDRGLDLASREAGSFLFLRLEDGAVHPGRPGEFYFASTGKRSSEFNPRGRLYRLRYDPEDPAAGADLTILLDGSEGIVSPDNLDVNRHGEVAICEDPTVDLSEIGLERDTRLWIYDLESGELRPLAEIDRPAAIAHAIGVDDRNRASERSNHPGGWEISGVVDAEEVLGRGAWLVNVQAHGLTIEPRVETVEGGQYLLVRDRAAE